MICDYLWLYFVLYHTSVVINIKVRVSAVCSFRVKKIAVRIASIHRMVGKYGGFEYMFFSLLVTFAAIMPRGIANIKVRYSIISFLREESF